MHIPSVSFSFLEAIFKRRTRAIEAEMKELMSAQFKMHLAVRISSGRRMVGKMTVCETHVQH